MALRYDPDGARRKVCRELSKVATAEWLAGGSDESYAAALLAAGQRAEAAADEERARAKHWRQLRKMVLADDRCHYCGEGATAVDHVMPYSRGGADTLENLVPACESCNMEKLDFTVEEWRDYRLERGEQWPPEGRNARIRRIIADLM